MRHPNVSPPTWAQPTKDEAATGRRAAKAQRKAARIVTSLIAQCDGCGCTDDAQHRIGRARHENCTGTFRLFGHGGRPPDPPTRRGPAAGPVPIQSIELGGIDKATVPPAVDASHQPSLKAVTP